MRRFKKNQEQNQGRERERFRVRKERKREKKEKFLKPNPWSKNSILVKLLLSARPSTRWCKYFGKEVIL